MSTGIYRCPSCGTSIEFGQNQTSLVCPACGNVITNDGATLVVNERTPATITKGEKNLGTFLWFLLIIPGAVFASKKRAAARYYGNMQQKIQHDASQIDNYLEQRVIILENLAALINKEMAFEKEVVGKLSSYHQGIGADNFNNAAQVIEQANSQMRDYINNNPEFRSTAAVQKAIKDNDYLQREITAARELYNDSIKEWNDAIFGTITQRLVAVEKHYLTRVPFTTTREIREKARSVLF